jgi:DNA-binding PadR family transcriptional regulator
MIEGAQLSNSFIILMVLNDAKGPLSSAEISKSIALYSGGHIYKLASTLKDSLESRLKREGCVESIDLSHKSLYSITYIGRKLLKGWIAFLSVY